MEGIMLILLLAGLLVAADPPKVDDVNREVEKFPVNTGARERKAWLTPR